MGKNKVKPKGLRVVMYCPVHGVTTFKYRTSYHRKAKKEYGRYECIACSNDWHKNRARERKIMAVEYKGGKCARCGGVFEPCVYDFHHVDPSTKEYKPSQLFSGKWEKLTVELDKCIMVCANCHRLIHNEEGY